MSYCNVSTFCANSLVKILEPQRVGGAEGFAPELDPHATRG